MKFGKQDAKIDLELREGGIWAEVALDTLMVVGKYAEKPDIESGFVYLKIAAMSNKKSRQLQREISPLYNTSKPEETRKYLAKIMAETVLKDWAGVDDDKGKPLTYTPDLGYEAMASEEYEWISDVVLDVAKVDTSFMRERMIKTGKS